MTKRKSRWLIYLALLAAAGAYGTYVYSRGSLRFLVCRLAFNYYLSKDTKEIEQEARSGLSSVYYFTSYYLNGILSAVEGTGSERILRRATKCMDTMIDQALEFKEEGRMYKAWRPFAISSESDVPRPNLHFTFQAMVPFARAAAIINGNPRFKAKYGVTAQRYIAFADESIVQYWFRQRLKGENPWINPDHFPIWNDNGSNLALVLTFLYRATGDRRYFELAEPVGTYFKSKLSLYGRGWIWEHQTIPIGSDTDNTPGSVGNQAGVPDTSHANREAMLVISMHEAGMVFSREDVVRMTHTFTDYIWNQSMDNPSFSNYINGNDKPYRVYKEPGLNGSVYHGFALLSCYSPLAQDVMFAALTAILRGNINPSLVRNVTAYGGALSICGSLLRSYSGLPEPPKK